MSNLLIGASSPTQVFLGTNEVSEIYLGTTLVWSSHHEPIYFLQNGANAQATWSSRDLNSTTNTTSGYLHTYTSMNQGKRLWYTELHTIPQWAKKMHMMGRYYYESGRGRPWMAFGLISEDVVISNITYASSGRTLATMNEATIQSAELQPTATTNPGDEWIIDISSIDYSKQYRAFVTFYSSSSTDGKRTDAYYSNVWFD